MAAISRFRQVRETYNWGLIFAIVACLVFWLAVAYAVMVWA